MKNIYECIHCKALKIIEKVYFALQMISPHTAQQNDTEIILLGLL